MALAYLGRIPDAIKQIDAAIVNCKQDDESLPVLLATLGLISVRGGAVAQGESLYLRALERFIDQKARVSAILAALHWTREESRLGFDEAPSLLKTIKKVAKNLPLPSAHDVQAMISTVEEEARQAPSPVHVNADELKLVREKIPHLESTVNQKWTKPPANKTRRTGNVIDLLSP